MYETPTLTPIGSAEKVIRGIFSLGWDLDHLLMEQTLEFRNELDILSPPE